MTADNQTIDHEYENVYQGKKWSMGKVLGIFAIVCLTMIIRDIGMVFVYGSIYDRVALEGLDCGVSFLNYLFTVLLFILPLVFPLIITLRKGTYFNEPQSSLLPSFGKVGSIIMYVLLVLVLIVPVSLTVLGLFTTAYMFIAVNMALVLVTNVVIFYYFGTYVLQRAKSTLSEKYIMPTLLMIVCTIISIGVTVGVTALLGLFGVDLTVVSSFKAFAEGKELMTLIIPGAVILLAVAAAAVFSGWLYHLTQNIIYAVVPTFVFAYPNVVLFQRISEASGTIAKLQKSIENSSSQSKIAEYEAQLVNEQVGLIISYVLVGLMLACLLAIGVYALVGMIKNQKEAK